MTHPFDDALTLQPLDGDCFQGRPHPGYANMVGPFGGISAAQMLQAVMLHPRRLGEPVSVTVNFCAAVADAPFTLLARPVRTNRSTQHWIVEMTQGEDMVMSATVVTAVRRDTWEDVEHPMPAVAPADAVPVTRREHAMAWLDRYEMRVVDGDFPAAWDGQGLADSRTRLWVRDQPPRPLDALALVALCDVFFPRVWRRRATRVPIGTVSFTVYLHADARRLRAVGDAPLLGQAQAQCFRGGFFDQAAQVWSADGDLLASTHQVVYFKD
jgi:acyl-CoA thioesterase